MVKYSKQIIVDEIGLGGQKKLANAKVLVVGAGGLGTPLVTYLSSMGIGKIGVVDGDKISESNLSRQFFYSAKDLNKSKVDVLISKLTHLKKDTLFDKYSFYINHENIKNLISNYDVICDCTDNVEARQLIDEHSRKLNKPLIYASVSGWEGYISILNYKKKIQLSDIFTEKDLKYFSQNSCNAEGVISSVCGLVGSLQANEVLKVILELKDTLDGKILCISLLKNVFKTFKITPIA